MKYRDYVEHVLVEAGARPSDAATAVEALADKKMLRRPLDEEGDVEIVTNLHREVVRELWVPTNQRPHKHPRGGM